eukprot:5014296-Ditylum_brightwellii.AAC.1
MSPSIAQMHYNTDNKAKVSWLTTERRESELASRKLPSVQNRLVVVCMGCPHAVRTTEAGTQKNLRRRMLVDLILCET